MVRGSACHEEGGRAGTGLGKPMGELGTGLDRILSRL